MCLAEVLARKSHEGELFLGDAFKDKSCRKDVFSGGGCKEDSRRWICLAEVLSRICLAEARGRFRVDESDILC